MPSPGHMILAISGRMGVAIGNTTQHFVYDRSRQ
jgi:hypothetical protein